ncbi:MAG: 8-amino-7-oxononanoate synthase [Balneolaceae bacterium]|nr:8-amino-7-oxononanoate synthase [Balneolaceae bacterium]
MQQALQQRRKLHTYRNLQPVKPAAEPATVLKDGRKLVDFSSNDYLGLARHAALAERAKAYADQYGTGSTASRLISGSFDIHLSLEEKLAEFFGSESVLLFNSGFQANSTIIETLTGRHSLVLADRLSHNSLIQGSLLSRGTFRRFDHNDMGHLQSMLERAREENHDRILIVTESLFSMNGDRVDIPKITELANHYEALLFVDDAHAVGVWGEDGKGLAHGVDGIDLVLGTFGKAFGAFGSFVACSNKMKEYLVNFCSGFIYTTALPPPVIGAVDAALELMPGLKPERVALRHKIHGVRSALTELGYRTIEADSQIVPILTGDENETLALSEHLEKHGLLAVAIRPPTVPEDSSRIRLTLTSAHTAEHIERLLDAFRQWGSRGA